MKLTEAHASQLPWRDGDGYSWGGEAILTIGDKSIMIGAGKESVALAQEMARRWNAGIDDTLDAEMESELPDWAVEMAAALMGVEGDLPPTTHDIARALVAAERRGAQRAAPLARQLEKALARAEDGAGTLPARQAVKLRPDDWHRVADLSRELAAAIRQIGGEG